MTRGEFDGASLATRLCAYQEILACGWDAYLSSIVPGTLGGVFTAAQQTDMAIEALGIAAGRWAAKPNARPKRASAGASVASMKATMQDGRDPVRPGMVESLTESMHGAYRDIGSNLDLERDVRLVFVPLQLAAMRTGAVRAFAAVMPRASAQETLDQHLREHLPPGVSWLNS